MLGTVRVHVSMSPCSSPKVQYLLSMYKVDLGRARYIQSTSSIGDETGLTRAVCIVLLDHGVRSLGITNRPAIVSVQTLEWSIL